MLRNYLIIAWRNLWNSKVFSLINIVGLAVAMAACLLIYVYIDFERSYDTFHKNGSNIYRYVFSNILNGVKELPQSTSGAFLGPILKSHFPEVEEYARLHEAVDPVFSSLTGINEKQIHLEEKIFFADPSFLEFFSFPLLAGNKKTALNEPNCIVITESIARKYFGWESANENKLEILNKNLLSNGFSLKITGVVADIPPNSHIKFKALISMSTLKQWWKGFDETPVYTGTINYLRLSPEADLKLLEKKIYDLMDEEFGEMLQKFSTVPTFQLQPIREIHLHSAGFIRETEIRGNIQTVRFLMVIGLFILFIAWINYINLTTARSMKRAREVSLKRIMGARKKQLVQQFLLEAMIVNVAALLLALTLVQIAMPYFAQLVGKDLQADLVNTRYMIIVFGFLFLGIAVSGVYPAMLLSSFKALSMLNGIKVRWGNNGRLRKTLVVFQYMITFGMILGTFAVFKQLSFMQNRSLGFDIDQMLVIRAPNVEAADSRSPKYEVLKNNLLNQTAITGITASYNIPGGDRIGDGYFMSKINNDEVRTPFPVNSVDTDFFETYNMEIKYGRNFLTGIHNDQNSIIITEQAARDLGYDNPEEAMNEIIYNAYENIELSETWKGAVINPVVIGVLKDFNQNSLQTRVNGMIFQKENSIINRPFRYYALRLELDGGGYNKLTSVITNIEKIYKDIFTEDAFTYFFLDDYFNRQYQAEQKFGTYFGLFSILAISIACLGMFGLSLFTLQQRTKEIGIRKVNGAAIEKIFVLLSGDFIKLIIISVLIALPFTFILLKNWLQNFEYRIDLSLWIFLIPAITVIIIALLTISYQSIKAALANPVKALRYE